ncbi:MAG TPA: hypothetical protein PKH79_09680 [Prolixibacteraceae bacterium]|nr:hypothetical protein [Prolixibacteraceae bacterium]HPS12233.1 hypothetical protein [Prolixibacteraceae bacterium]
MDNLKTEILNDLMDEIGKKEFDLDAWKMKALMVFRKFFGPEDEKIGFIENLRYDYSSWTLRDSAGSKQPDSVKEKARRIIETALLEISMTSGEKNEVLEVLQEELTGKEYASMMEIVEKSENLSSDLNLYFGNLAASKKEQVLSTLVLKSMKK